MGRLLEFRHLDFKHDGDMTYFLQVANERERQRTRKTILAAIMWTAVVVLAVMFWAIR